MKRGGEVASEGRTRRIGRWREKLDEFIEGEGIYLPLVVPSGYFQIFSSNFKPMKNAKNEKLALASFSKMIIIQYQKNI